MVKLGIDGVTITCRRLSQILQPELIIVVGNCEIPTPWYRTPFPTEEPRSDNLLSPLAGGTKIVQVTTIVPSDNVRLKEKPLAQVEQELLPEQSIQLAEHWEHWLLAFIYCPAGHPVWQTPLTSWLLLLAQDKHWLFEAPVHVLQEGLHW